MEGQAVSDWEKCLATCMFWCRFWFSRSSWQDRMRQEQEWGSRVEGPGGSVAHRVSSALLESGELPASMDWDASVLDFGICSRSEGAQLWPSGTANLTPSLPWQQWGGQDPTFAPWQPGGLGTGTFLKYMQIYTLNRHIWSPEKNCLPGALAALCL